MDSKLSEVKVGMHQDSVLSLFLLAMVVDDVSTLARHGVLGEFVYPDE